MVTVGREDTVPFNSIIIAKSEKNPPNIEELAKRLYLTAFWRCDKISEAKKVLSEIKGFNQVACVARSGC